MPSGGVSAESAVQKATLGPATSRLRTFPFPLVSHSARTADAINWLTFKNMQPDLTTVSHVISEPEPTAEARADRSLEMALAAAQTAHDNRGQDIVVLDMREVTPIFDYFVVVTGNSRRQLHAISEEIDHTLEDELDDERMGIEGYRESRWILLDYGTVVIHIFDPEMREFYALEDFWNQAKRVDLPWQDAENPASE